jgi:TonB family protein
MKIERPVLLSCLLAAALSFAAPRAAAAAAEDFLIRATLLQGIPEDEAATLAPDTVVTTFRLTATPSAWPGPEQPAGPASTSFRDDLARIYRLSAVESLSENTWPWSDAPGGVGGYVMFGRETFRLVIRPAFAPPGKMKLAIAVSRPKRKGRAEEKVLATELIASLDDRVVAGFMTGGKSYFLSVLVTRDPRKGVEGEAAVGASQAWVPVSRVPLVLPESGARAEVQGDVVLRVSVDPAGKVTDVRVLKSLQVDIDVAAVQAVRQWTFEPAEPAEAAKTSGPATFGMSFRFTRRSLEPPAEPGEEPEAWPEAPPPAPVPAAGELGMVLASCADYCRALSGAALDFVCEERIAEEIYDYRLTYGTDLASDIPSGLQRQVRKNGLLYDYQLVQGPAGIRENRTLLEENGQKKAEKNAPLKTRRFYSYRSVYGPAGLFGRDRWPLFDYRLAGRETLAGRKALVIEVTPKPSVDQPVTYGKAWVDQESRRILKIEIAAKALVGYERLREASDLSETRPLFTTVHYYETEKNGLMFPSRTVFREAYMTPSGRRVQKSKTEITFSNYRFFTVSVETEIVR